ncbi:MAG: arsenate reductase family protein [Clostridia bacterium]
MNIQIFGSSKCFDTKKAQRYFKERNVKFQFIDVAKFSMSMGEFNNISRAIGGGVDALINQKSKKIDSSFINYLASEEAKIEKLLDTPELFKTPIVRNGKKATLGFCPEIWKEWE